jgi:hypothetical protein
VDVYPLTSKDIKLINLTIWIKSKLSKVHYLKTLKDSEWRNIVLTMKRQLHL